jgi:hypothetical protein
MSNNALAPSASDLGLLTNNILILTISSLSEKHFFIQNLALIAKMNAWKTKNPNIKISMSVGGEKLLFFQIHKKLSKKIMWSLLS